MTLRALSGSSSRLRLGAAITVAITVSIALAGCSASSTNAATTSTAPSASASASSSASTSESATPATIDPKVAAVVEPLVNSAMNQYHVRGMIVQVTQNGTTTFEKAYGESMTGVPVTTDMRFRNGALAFTYIGQTVVRMVDEGKIRLTDPLSTWFPAFPHAQQITIKNLLNMTSGYADYVYQPQLGKDLNRDPFQQYTNKQLIAWGLSAPMDFAPGTNWGYSHTNYVILGEVLQKVTGKPLDQVLQQYVLDPMGLTHTSANDNTPAIPEPVMHVFSSERKQALGIPASTPFMEESTFWNPSWTTAEGAVETTTINDMTRSMEIVGQGSQVSPEMYKEQTGNNLLGFGHKDPTGRCTVCDTLTTERNYGLGVVLIGPWILQAKSFAGSAAISGYDPTTHLAISVVTTYLPEAYDYDGNYVDASRLAFMAIGKALGSAAMP